MKTFTFYVSAVDICLSGYLQRGSSDKSELLIGTLGQTLDETVEELLRSANDERWIEDWEGANEEEMKTAIKAGIEGLDLRYIDPQGNPQDERPEEGEDEEEPNLYVWLDWTVEVSP
jgi:hypothetical protein